MNTHPAGPHAAAPAPTPSPAARRSRDRVLLAGTMATGLVAGTYFAFTCAVMPGLAATDDRTFVAAMQAINVKIENPVFFAGFFGAFVLPLVAVFRQRKAGGGAALRWTIAGLALYTAGLLTTMGFNIPLNNTLRDAGDAAALADPGAVRRDFEDPWVAWNIVRTAASTAAAGCLVYAMRLRGRATAES